MKKIKMISWVLCFLAIILFLLVASIPTWICSSIGTKTLLKWINAKIEGELSVEKIELSWLGKQGVEQLTLRDQEGKILFSVDHFETNTSFLYLALGGCSLGKTEIQSPYLVLTEEPLKKIEELSITGKSKKSRHCWIFPFFKESLNVSNGQVIFSKKGMLPITLFAINIEKKNKSDQFHLHAQTKHGQSEGVIAVDTDLSQNYLAKIELIDFPLAIIDELTASNFYTTALGDRLNVNVNLEKSPHGSLSLVGSADSTYLKAYISGSTEEKTFSLDPQTHLKFTLTPALFKLLVDEKQRGQWDLASKTDLEIHIEKGIFPLSLKKIDYKEMTLQASAFMHRAELHHSGLGSYSLKQFDVTLTALNNLEINYQGEILGKEATHFTGNVSITAQAEVLYHSTFKGFPITLIGLFSSKLESNLRLLFGSQIDLISYGTFIDDKIEAEMAISSPKLETIGSLKGSFEALDFEVGGTLFIQGNRAKIIGSSVEFSLNGALHFDQREAHIPSIEGKLFNPYLNLALQGSIREPGLLLENTSLVINGELSHLPTSDDFSLPDIKDILLFIQIDGAKNQIIGKAAGEGLLFDCRIADFIYDNQIDFPKSNINFNSHLKEFPVAFITPFISESLDLVELIGPKLTLRSKGIYAPTLDPRFVLDLEAEASGFSTSLAISVDGTLTISHHKPSYIFWQMTPKRYLSLIQQFKLYPEKEPTFLLSHPTDIKLNIKELSCPKAWPKKLGPFLCQGGFIGDLEIGTMTFQPHNREEVIVFKDIIGSVKGVNFSEAIDLILKGEIVATRVPQSEQSAFSFEGTMLNFWRSAGKFNREGLTVKGVLNLDLLPVRPVLGIIPFDPQTRIMAQALLGELLNARIEGEISQLSGPVTVDIKSSNFKAVLPLQFQPHAILLRDFVDAQITLTEDVNEVFLKDINPLLITGAYSDHPIKLYIEAAGFVLPLRPYHLQNIQVGKAIVDIGKIRVRNGGQIRALTEFLKAKEVSRDGVMQAWFTPIYLSYHNGVASYLRFDALFASNIHIAMWGSINLINNQVNMTLGISSATLHQRFKISGLGNREMFQVKMRGTTEHLELDWGSASTRLALILAKASGGLGSLIGGLLESLSSALGEQPAPAPTTNPLPWEKS